MTAVEFITGINRTEIDECVLELLKAQIGADGIPRFLYLSPTLRKNRRMASLLRERRLSWRGDFHTPGEFAQKIAESLPGPVPRWVSPELKVLIIHRILRDLQAKGDPVTEALCFRDGRTPMGVARHAAKALDHLTRRGLSPADREAGLSDGVGRALDALQQGYEKKLDAMGRSDPVGIPLRAAKALEENGRFEWDRAELLVLDGFVAPEKIEAEFLLALVRRFSKKKITVTIPLELADALEKGEWGDLPGHLRAFGRGEEFFTRLGWKGSASVVPAAGGKAEPCRVSTPRELHRYADRTEEVKGIAGAIKRIFFRAQGRNPLKPEDFHVVVPHMDSYYRLFIELFPRYGIPFNITRGIPLASIPVVSLIASLLDAAGVRDHEALFRFFSSDLVTVPSAEPEEFETFCEAHGPLIEEFIPEGASLSAEWDEMPRSDIRAVDGICREAEMRGGPDIAKDWLVPLSRYFGDLMLKARASEDADDEARVRNHFLATLWQIGLLDREFREFDRIRETHPVEDIVGGVEILIERYEIRSNLIRSLMEVEREIPEGGRIILEKNVKGFDRAFALLSELADDLKRAGEPETNAETFREPFLERCRSEMIQEAGELAGVGISQTLEIRNMARPVLFLAGLTAKDFPLVPTHNFLLPRGPDADSFRRAVDESRLIFRQAMENSDRIIFSYPAADGDEPMEVSPFLEDLIHNRELDPAEVGPDDTDPLCRYEILQAVGGSWSEGARPDLDRIARILERTPVRSEESLKSFHHEIRRALAQVLLRNRTDEPGPFDGIIRDPETLAAIGEMLDARRFAYSTSMLNEYLGCGLAFFFHRILGLEPIREIPEEPEPVSVGSAVHEILAEFYRRWSAAGQGRVTSGNRVEAIIAMCETAGEILGAHRFIGLDLIGSHDVRERVEKGLYSKEALSDGDLLNRVRGGTDMPAEERGPLRLLIDHEAEVDLSLYPWSMEYAFGFEDNPPLVVTREGRRPIRIRGRIDRIDLYRTEPGAPPTAAWVYDYKTGGFSGLTQVKQGLDLQLQVYLLAVTDGVCGVKVKDAGACFLHLKQKEKNPRKVVIFTSGVPDDLRPKRKNAGWELTDSDPDLVRQQIRDVDEAIRKGQFPRSRDKAGCKWCGFVNACFRDEHREGLFTA